MDQSVEFEHFEPWKPPAEVDIDSLGLAAGLADRLLRVLAWLRWECTPGHLRRRGGPPAAERPLLLRLEGGETEFEKLYAIGEKIGQGSFGKVFACRDLQCQPGEEEEQGPLCVKVVPLQGRRVARVAKVCETEKREILCQCLRIEHPNIVKYHRFVHTDDALYTVMERCCGLDLVDQVKEEGEHLPILRIRSLSQQILSAVYAVHNVGIMHRDIKPENFRFKDMTAQVLQLLDFGFAKPAGDAPATHSVTGTLLYAAPEVFDGTYCQKCDLWSTGVVLFQLFTGHPPFQTSDVQILRSLHRDPVLTGDSLFRGVPQRQMPQPARGFLRGLLTVEPADRLSAEEAVRHEWLLPEGEGSEPEDSAEAQVSPSMRKSTLRRDSSNISIKGDEAELKRSYFVWDLAAAASGEEDDEQGESAICSQT